jgi:hypothetical protein
VAWLAPGDAEPLSVTDDATVAVTKIATVITRSRRGVSHAK